MDFYKTWWVTIYDVAKLVATVFLFAWVFGFLFDIAAPIFISFFIYLLIKPLSNLLEKIGLKKSIAVTLSTLTLVAVVLGFFIVLGAVITSQIQHLTNTLPKYTDTFQYHFNNTVNYLQEQYKTLPVDTADSMKENFGKFAEKGTEFATTFLVWLFSFLSSIPKLIMNFTIGLILAFFLALEIDGLHKVAKEKTPKTFKTAFTFLKENVIKGISGYLKAQMILISITFVIVLIGLFVFGVQSAFVLAIVAAILDVLPLLGVSSLFLPWIIYLFFTGDTTFAIQLSILLGIVLVFRQIMEPKITGNSLGVKSAFIMLSAMVIFMAIFGVAGLILSPIIIILLKALYDQGYLKKWIRLPEEEFEKKEKKEETTS